MFHRMRCDVVLRKEWRSPVYIVPAVDLMMYSCSSISRDSSIFRRLLNAKDGAASPFSYTSFNSSKREKNE